MKRDIQPLTPGQLNIMANLCGPKHGDTGEPTECPQCQRVFRPRWYQPKADHPGKWTPRCGNCCMANLEAFLTEGGE